MMEDNLDVNERTKKELDERRKSKDFISHEDVKKRYIKKQKSIYIS